MMYRTAILQGCINVEHSVASIYRNLMQIFPEKKDFWGNLYNDEKDHIEFLNDVKSLGLSDDLEKVDLLPTMPMIQKTLRLADDVIEKIKSNSITFNDALSLTLKIEESMVETYTSNIVGKLLSCADEASCEMFITDEKSHVEKIRIMMRAI
jgi:hypothetical protein